MHTFSKLAAVAATALLLSTSLASALDPIGVNEIIAPTPEDSIQDAVQSSTPTDSINDAVLFDPEGAIQDAVLEGAKPATAGNATAGGHDIVLAFACEAAGTELLTLRNTGDVVPAGTKVRWEVARLGERGAVRLRSALGSGDKVRVDIGMDVDAGTPCIANAI